MVLHLEQQCKENKTMFFRKRDEESEVESMSSKATSVSSGIKGKKRNLTKWYEPFEAPLNPIKRPVFDLTPEQEEKYNHLLSYFETFVTKELPVNDRSGAATHPILESEKAWLTKECFLRYLRASKWKQQTAIKRIEDTLVWRRTFGVTEVPGHTDPKQVITPDLVEHENVTGKHLILGYDNDNRPCLYLRNGYQNTPPSMKQVQHLVFYLERVIQFMPPGQDTLALLIDFKAAPEHLKLSSKFPSLSISKQVLHILQNHYPERLGRGLFTNIPWIGYTFFKVVGPFIDPYTRSKTIYDQPFENFVPQEQLDKEFNGLLDFEYIHEVYWKKMNEVADKKYSVYLDNFRKMGGGIGMSEYDLRGGE
ncbi:lipid biosynthesis and multidrug resistance [Meyerozyma guilliermondii]